MSGIEIFSLRGMTAVVTGGSRGIGHAIANGLTAAGARVLSLARSLPREEARLHGVVHACCDMLDADGFAACVGEFLAGCRLNILVNAAGITRPGSTLEDFDATLAVNLRAPFWITLKAVDLMGDLQGSSIINVTSLAAARGFPGNPGYVAAKGGLSQLTRALAYDLGPRGIRVNNLVPGYIVTDMTRNSFSDPGLRAERERHTMLGRWGQPEDLVGAAVFLASRASSYITGQDIVVDGGWLAKGLA